MTKKIDTKKKKEEAQAKISGDFGVLVKSMKAFTKKYGGHGLAKLQNWVLRETNRVRILGEIDAKKRELKNLK